MEKEISGRSTDEMRDFVTSRFAFEIEIAPNIDNFSILRIWNILVPNSEPNSRRRDWGKRWRRTSL